MSHDTRTANQLKSELRQRGLPVGGNKATLLERLRIALIREVSIPVPVRSTGSSVDSLHCPLLNDLLSVISTYTTTISTFWVMTLTTDVVHRIYGAALWRDKAYYEARGVVIDPILITSWYAYYLMRNRTYYGRPVLVDAREEDENARISSPTGPSGVMLIYCGQVSAGFGGVNVIIPLYQTEDFILRARAGIKAFSDITSANLGGRIRMSTSWQDHTRAFLTERGAIWSLSALRGPQKRLSEPIRILAGSDIVDIQSIGKDSWICLDRKMATFTLDAAGVMAKFHQPIGVPLLTQLDEPIIELGTGTLTRGGMYHRYSGLSVRYPQPTNKVQRDVVSLGMGEVSDGSWQTKEPVRSGLVVKLLIPVSFNPEYARQEPQERVVAYYTSQFDTSRIWVDSSRTLSFSRFPPLVSGVQFIEPAVNGHYLLLVD